MKKIICVAHQARFANRVRYTHHARCIYGARPGTSLLIALGLITVIILISISMTTMVVSAIRESANVNRATEAFYAAQGALEEGLMLNQGQGAGYNTDVAKDALYICNGKNAQNCGLKGLFAVQGTVPSNVKYQDGSYGVPTPGSGTAGKDCDRNKPVIEGSFYYKNGVYYKSDPGDNPAGPFEPKDHPCNWNKIKVGESVTIPLYVTQADGQVLNPVELGLSTLKVRVRTPCSDGMEMCPGGAGRFKLENTSADQNAQFAGDDPIVSWQIVGTDPKEEETYVLQPAIDYDDFNNKWPLKSSIIYESKINFNLLVDPYEVLSEKKNAFDKILAEGVILSFIKNLASWNNQQIYKPVLILSLIHSLEEKQTKAKVSNLEYQILVNANTSSPTDINQTITAEGFSGSFKQVLEVKLPQGSDILQYVIQQ